MTLKCVRSAQSQAVLLSTRAKKRPLCERAFEEVGQETYRGTTSKPVSPAPCFLSPALDRLQREGSRNLADLQRAPARLIRRRLSQAM